SSGIGNRVSRIGGAFEQGEEGARLDVAEQQQIQLHGRREHAQHRASRSTPRDAFLPLGACDFQRVLVRHGTSTSTRSTSTGTSSTFSTLSTLSTIREPLFSEPHEDVLDEAADE